MAGDKMYKMDGRIRYSEVGMDGTLTMTGLVNYFQDCSTFHSEDVGLGLEFLLDRGRAWILSGWQIVIERMPGLDEHVCVSTWPYEFKGFMGMRNYEMTDSDGKRLAAANSLWTLIDVKKRCPVRIVDEDIDGYEIEEKADMVYAPRKIKPQGECRKEKPVYITRERIDTNGHMNNGQYIGIASEYLPEDVSVRQIRVEYRKEVRAGEELIPYLYGGERGLTVVLDRADSDCAVVEFTW